MLKFIFLLFLLAISKPDGLHASQCIPKSFKEIVNGADIIFMGKVIERQPVLDTDQKYSFSPEYLQEHPQCGSKIATIRVEQTWKSDGFTIGDEVRVHATDACYWVSSYLSLDQEYIVFANTNPDQVPHYRIGTVCDGTTGLNETKRAAELQNNLDNYFDKKLSD